MAELRDLPGDDAWQAIDFIADLHLSDSTPRTFDVFARYLRETSADAVFILGDLFEVWIGDDARPPGSFARRATDALTEAAARRWIGVMVGNRDFLLGSAMLRAECGVTPLEDPTVLDAWGRRVVLTHGDALCIGDTEYQAFRAQVRTEAWQQAFLARPLVERERLARGMRDASEANKRARPVADWVDVDAPAARQWLDLARSLTLVHGHTHRPASEAIAPGYERHVLSDWDLEAVRPRAQALRLTREGFSRIDLVGGA